MSTFVLIEKYTVGAGGVSSVTLGSGGTLPQTFTDLVVKVSARSSSTNPDLSWMRISLNGSTSSFTYRKLYGNGTGAYSDTGQDIAPIATTETANTFGNDELYIPNYTSSNYKSLSIDGVGEANVTKTYTNLQAVLWSNTAAITSITLTGAYNNFAQYSTFYLYGILKA